MSHEDRVNAIHCLAELEGYANRRRYIPVPKWTVDERAIIVARKYKLQDGRCRQCDPSKCNG